MKQITTAEMCEGPLFGKIIRYTVPIILTSVLQLLFNAADLIVVGRFCGSISVAAVGATGSLINLLVNMFIGLSVGAGVRVAQALGAGKDDYAQKIIHTAIPIAVICGIFLTVVGVFGADFFLTLMGTPDNVRKLSVVYMKLYFAGMTSSLVYNFGAAILRAAGDTKGPLVFLSSAGVINVVLNVFFVLAFKMDVAGVALATAISQTVSAVLVIISLMKRKDACRFSFRKMRIDRFALGKILVIGLPAGIQGSLFSISNVIIQSSVNSFGDIVMSGNAASQNLEGFVYVIMNAFHQTALNFTGQNYGAAKYERLKKITRICLLSVGAAGFVAGALVTVFSHPLLSIYITDSAEAIQYGELRLLYIALPYFLCGIMDVTTGVLRGMGSSVAPMIISVVGVCGFRIGWIFTIFRSEAYHSLQSLYISYPISWALTFLAELTVFIVLYRKIMKKQSSKMTVG